MGKGKKILAITLTICGAALIGFTIFGILNFSRNKLVFDSDGYVLGGNSFIEEKQMAFANGTEYTQKPDGQISFRTVDSRKASAAGDSFIRYSDGSSSALSDGIIMDFKDLSDNFINNYYIPAGVKLHKNGDEYISDSDTRTKFGEHLWKLADNKYLIQSPANKIYFSDEDIRDVGDYVQVDINEDGVCMLLTSENRWSTISPAVYIETAKGVKIYPLEQMVEDENYKISTAKLSVSPDDAIVLAKSETRRQIVPELNFEAIDGTDGTEGISGTEGSSGSNGNNGTDGQAGSEGNAGEDGGDGGTGSSGGGAGAAGANGYSAFQVWLADNNLDPLIETKDKEQAEVYRQMFVNDTNGNWGKDGKTAVELWNENNPDDQVENLTELLEKTGGDPGIDGITGEQAWAEKTGEDISEYAEKLKGKDGETGDTGVEGGDGDSGNDGLSGEEAWALDPANQGKDYATEHQGATGKSGEQVWAEETGKTIDEYDAEHKGRDGGPGGGGPDGASTTASSSTKTALPMMHLVVEDKDNIVKNLHTSSNRIYGTIRVDDNGELLGAVNPSDGYYGHVVIYDMDTNEKIWCNQIDKPVKEGDPEYVVDYEGVNFTDFNPPDGQTEDIEVYFDSDKVTGTSERPQHIHQLEPNKAYRLSATCYYKDSTSGLVFEREFISRVFYTDSTGITLAEGESTTKTIKFNYRVNAGERECLSTTELYLVKPNYEDDFKVNPAKYDYKYTLDYKNNTVTLERHDSETGADEEIDIPAEDLQRINTHLQDSTNNNLDLVFYGLPANTEYILNGVIEEEELSGSLQTILDQTLKLSTLKRSPTWDEEILPSMSYNRVTGNFDVYRPLVDDPDNGIVQYKYTIIKKNPDNTESVITTGILGPTDHEPATFTLPTNNMLASQSEINPNYYKVQVEMEFYDNEKTVYYDLGTSPTSYTEGTYLPKVSLVNVGKVWDPDRKQYVDVTTPDKKLVWDEDLRKWVYDKSGATGTQGTPEMNTMSGTIRIDLGTSRSMLPIGQYMGDVGNPECYPLDIDIAAESYSTSDNAPYYEERFNYVGETMVAKDNQGNVLYTISDGTLHSQGQTESQIIDIDMQLNYLRANTDYTVTLKGWLNTAPNSEHSQYVYQTIGQVRFRTPAIAAIDAHYEPDDDTDGQFKIYVNFTSETAFSAYDLEQIKNGAVELRLYEGTDTTGEPKGGTYIVTDPEELIRFVEPDAEGHYFPITPALFGSPDLDKEKKYTIHIAGAADCTYFVPDEITDNDVGKRVRLFTNYFPTINSREFTMSPKPTPPDLPANPSGAISATPITLGDAVSKYDSSLATYYPGLKTDSIVGYRLKVNFQNFSLMARKLNLSLFEYNAFYDELCKGVEHPEENHDPLGNYMVTGKQTNIPTVWTHSFNIDASEGEIPEVAVFFGNGEGWPQYEGDDWTKYQQYNNALLYFAGDVQEMGTADDPYIVGMDRGYRYTAAYTMEVVLSETEDVRQLYPYCMQTFDSLRASKGIGMISWEDDHGAHDTDYLFPGVAYVLNAGLLEAPKQEPEFNTILTQNDVRLVSPGVYDTGTGANASATVEYHYIDVDGTSEAPHNYIHSMSLNGGTDVEGEGGTVVDRIVELGENDGLWGHFVQFDMTGITSGGAHSYIEDVMVDRHLYNLDYNPMLTDEHYRMNPDILMIDFAAVVADWDYKTYIEGDGAGGRGLFQVYDDSGSANPKRMRKKVIGGKEYLCPIYDIVQNTQMNYIDIKERTEGGKDPLDTLWRRSVALKVVATSTKEGEAPQSKTLYLPTFAGTDGIYSARLSLDTISDMLGKGYSLSLDVTMLYDTGNLGWNYSENYDQYALQYFGETEGTFRIGKYILPDTTVLNPAGALYEAKESATRPLGVIRSTTESKTRESFSFRNPTKGENVYFARGLYPYIRGVDAGTGSKPAGNTYLIPKEIRAIPLSDDGKPIGIDFVTPVITYDPNKNLLSGVSIGLADFTVKNADQSDPVRLPGDATDYYEVYASIYQSTYDEDGNLLQQLDLETVKGITMGSANDDEFRVKGSADDGRIRFLVKKVDKTKSEIYGYYKGTQLFVRQKNPDTGKYEYVYYDGAKKGQPDPDGGPTFDNLNSSEDGKDNNYYINFQMLFDKDDPAKRKNAVLIDSKLLADHTEGVDTHAAYWLQTASKANIKIIGLYYPEYVEQGRNPSADYFQKKLDVAFSIDRTKDIKMHYELYTALQGYKAEEMTAADWDAYFKSLDPTDEKAWEKIHLFHSMAEIPSMLIDFNIDPGINLATDLDLSRSNIVPLRLTPELMNRYGIPGVGPGTYWVRVTATEGDGASAQVAGYAWQKFEVPTSDRYGFYATLAERKMDELEFWVGSSDPTDTFMGYHSDTGSVLPGGYEDKGLYAVRFTKVRREADPVTGVETVYHDWIPTIYDNNLYRLNDDIRQKFIFNSSTANGVQIDKNTEYEINIYAVWDQNNGGNITYVNKSGNTVTVAPQKIDSISGITYEDTGWQAYFGDVSYRRDEITGSIQLYSKDKLFSNFLSNFWGSYDNTKKCCPDNPLRDELEGQFCLYTRSVKTANDEGIIIGKYTNVAPDIHTLQLRLKESSGLVIFDTSSGKRVVSSQLCTKIIWTVQDPDGPQVTKILDRDKAADREKMFGWDEEDVAYILNMDLGSSFSLEAKKQYEVTIKLYDQNNREYVISDNPVPISK